MGGLPVSKQGNFIDHTFIIRNHFSRIQDRFHSFRNRMHTKLYFFHSAPDTMPKPQRNVLERRIDTRGMVPLLASFSRATSKISFHIDKQKQLITKKEVLI